MRTHILFMLAAILPAAAAAGDVVIRQEERSDPYYSHGIVQPAEVLVGEYWISAKAMSLRLGRIQLLADLEKGSAVLLNLEAKTFVTTVLPLNLEAIADEATVPLLKRYKRRATVQPLGRTSKAGERPCVLVALNTWIPVETSRYWDTLTEACYAAELPFDRKAVAPLLEALLVLGNLDAEAVKALGTIEGFQVAAVSTRYTEGTEVKSTLRTLELAVRDAPPGTYAVPDGFTPKEKATMQDLQER